MSAAVATRAPDLTARRAAIVRLLERYDELVDPGGRHGAGSGGHVPLMPHAKTCRMHAVPPRCTCWQRDVRELERLLARMRNRGRQEAYGGWPLSVLRFHVLAWYVNATKVGQWQPVVVKKGRKLQVPTGQDVLRTRSGKVVPARYHVSWIREPDARQDRAELGVAWMAEHWGLEHEPQMPAEKEKRAA